MNVKTPGKYGDGAGLWLEIAPGGARSWSYRFTLDGRSREMSLGPLRAATLPQARSTLAQARRQAEECERLKRAGIDPIEDRRAQRAAVRLQAAKAMTFDECRDAYIAAHRAGWRNVKHGNQWRASLLTYATPVLGKLPVGSVDTGLVLKVLEPIWASTTETASRVRGRIEAVLDWARARGYRDGENPARWKGHLDQLLPPRSKVQKAEHHPALPYAQIGAFIAELRRKDDLSAVTLEFTILTAARTGEVIRARWSEINLVAKIWTIPGDRMKSGRDHRVPLSDRAMEILGILAKRSGAKAEEFLFPGSKGGAQSNMTLLALVRRMNGDTDPPTWRSADGEAIVPHGFRSTFKDWASEMTAFPNELSESALAHVIGDKTEAAYRRGDLFEKRRRLMEAWSKYCGTSAARSAGVATIGRGSR